MTATETAKSPPEPDAEAQADRRNIRLTLQAERAAQEIERRETRPRSWRRPRSWF